MQYMYCVCVCVSGVCVLYGHHSFIVVVVIGIIYTCIYCECLHSSYSQQLVLNNFFFIHIFNQEKKYNKFPMIILLWWWMSLLLLLLFFFLFGFKQSNMSHICEYFFFAINSMMMIPKMIIRTIMSKCKKNALNKWEKFLFLFCRSNWMFMNMKKRRCGEVGVHNFLFLKLKFSFRFINICLFEQKKKRILVSRCFFLLELEYHCFHFLRVEFCPIW